MSFHRIALFGYDFPHIKTCEFMIALKSWGYDVVCVLAAPWRKLNIVESQERITVRQTPPFHPAEIAKLLDIPYYSVKHNSRRLREIVENHKANLGIIGGARILKQKTIDTLDHGIINLHPGLIPSNRGLDCLKWAVYFDLPQAITAHFIDARIDAGYIIEKRIVPVFKDDALFDVAQRLGDAGLPLLASTMKRIEGKTWRDFDLVETETESRKAIPPDKERVFLDLLPQYLRTRDSLGMP